MLRGQVLNTFQKQVLKKNQILRQTEHQLLLKIKVVTIPQSNLFVTNVLHLCDIDEVFSYALAGVS